MHFAQALPDADGISINIFGAGSINGIYESSMTICQYNTQTDTWKQITDMRNVPLARRNAAYEVTRSNLTVIFGGNSELLTGLNFNSSYRYPNIWHQEIIIYDSKSNNWLPTPIKYSTGFTRVNSTITQIRDTNGQLVILGGAVINHETNLDRVTNFPLANMSDIILLDPRTSIWNNIKAIGNSMPIPRKHHTTTLHTDGRSLIIIGGEYFNETGAYLLNDVWILDTRNFSWSQPPFIEGVGLYRSNHTSILIKDQIWVIAGTNRTAKAVDIQLLNVINWSWSYLAVNINAQSDTQYSNIGGLPRLIGIVVGVVVCTLLLLFFILWHCYCRLQSTTKLHQDKIQQKAPKQLLCNNVANPNTSHNNILQQKDWNYQQQMSLFNYSNNVIPQSPSPPNITRENNNSYFSEANCDTEDTTISHYVTPLSRQSSSLYWDTSPLSSLYMQAS
ncbi:uncharacterized protein BX663DRAFT_509686 [Cokeromyces recurvatus]|uniref:uncharacterized protein n=1 Tax=Cokeromyces recurvatus TaxID=90255 RepID=UPI002220C12E|nr:uncharacterized protein BX663DRAFT_509686 [Cokeromyces recurvatus]KAI7902566.1 hypothetical protein BX663DRAFT_509686 [Cokeromyces recurvatus]